MRIKERNLLRIEVADSFRKNPTFKNGIKLCKKYGLSFGDFLNILRYFDDLRPFVEKLRAKNKEREIEANIRHRERRQERRWKKKESRNYGEVVLPDKTVWRFLLIPVGKNLKRKSGHETEKLFDEYYMPMVKHLVNAKVRYETKRIEKSHDYQWLSDFCKENNYPIKILDTVSRNLLPSLLSSPMRGTTLNQNVLNIQISGKAVSCGKCHVKYIDDKCPKCGKKVGLTAGSARIKEINGKRFLHIGSKNKEIIFEIYIKPDNDDDKYYKKLIEKLEKKESLFVTIKDERKWGHGFQCFAAGIREVPKFDYKKEIYLIFRPYIKLMKGAIEVFIFNKNGEQIYHMTPYIINWKKIAHADSKTRSKLLKAWRNKALAKVWKLIRQGKLSMYRPVCLFLQKSSDGSNREMSNWLGEALFFYLLRDKLSYIDGKLYQNIKPQELNPKIRLSL